MPGVAIEGRRFLITGGTGFLGTYLWQEIVRRGGAVRLFDYRASQTLEALPAAERPECHVGDVRDVRALADACQGVDGVFHCAALPSIARGTWSTYEGINVRGTENVLGCARSAGARRAVYLSSSTVYGVPDHSPLRESDPLLPQGPYSTTKVKAEQICARAADATFTVPIIRPRVILGAGRLGIFSLLFRRVLEGRPLFVLGRGRNAFQFTHVRDVVSGCLLAMERGLSEPYNVGCEELLGVRKELEALVDHAGSRSRIWPVPAGAARLALRGLTALGVSPLVHEQFSIADRDFVLATRKARDHLGWRPTASNLDCLIEAFDWFRAHQHEELGDGSALLAFRRSDRQGAFQREA